MPTHDYIIANGTGAAVRADINLALSAIVSLNSSASEPATMYAYQLWADTALGLLKIRNSANSAWITLRQLDGDFSIVAVEDGLQATPSLTFTNDLNTGVFRSGADALAIVTGGQYAIACTSTQAVGIKTANPSTALHVAGNARVGADDVTDAHLQIGKGATGNRNSYIDIVADTTYTDYGLRVIRNNTGANATSELKHRGTGALNFTTQEAAPIVFNTTNSPALTILAGGNVGIGASSPTKALEVAAGATSGNGILVTGSSSPQILLTANSSVSLSMQADSVAGYFGTFTNHPLNFRTNNQDRAQIDTSGRLLVGTSTSVQVYQGATAFNSELQVAGSSASLTIARTVGSANLFLTRNQTVNDGSPLGVISFNGGDGTNLIQAAQISAEVDGTPGANDMPGRLVFSTTADGGSSPTERMRISANGQHNIFSSDNGLVTRVSAVAGTTTAIHYGTYSATNNTNGTVSFVTWSNGNVQNTNNSYGAYSDIKLKENIVDANSQWDDLKALQVRNYNLKEGQTRKQIGLVAQEVELVSPGLVYESPDRDEDGNDLGTVTKSVSYSVLYMKAVKALQESMERIEQLETSNIDLLARVIALEAN